MVRPTTDFPEINFAVKILQLYKSGSRNDLYQMSICAFSFLLKQEKDPFEPNVYGYQALKSFNSPFLLKLLCT